MSYSFQVRAANKAAAIAAVAAKMAEVVANQPEHALDEQQAVAAATAYVELLADDDTLDVAVDISGSLSWRMEEPEIYVGARVALAASLVERVE